MMCLLPVTVMKMSPIAAASAIGMTAKPSIAASRAADRIDLGDDDLSAEAAGPQGDALAAPAVAAHDDLPAGQQQVGRADDAVDRALAGAVAVVEEVLGLGVVDGDDRELAARRPSPSPAAG